MKWTLGALLLLLLLAVHSISQADSSAVQSIRNAISCTCSTNSGNGKWTNAIRVRSGPCDELASILSLPFPNHPLRHLCPR